MTIKCPKCFAENPDTKQFCDDCGTPLPQKKDSVPTKTIETATEELTTGSIFAGRYQIIEDLGKGGMGRVYKVLDKETNEKIALKLIKPEIAADKKTIERFRNELTTARKIRHKNVCAMYDLNKEKDNYFITMEFVSGGDLKRLIRRTKRLDIGTAISIVKQICEGLEEAHSLGIIHRDLKPNNVMIDDNGNARIMDFGIARTLKEKGITGSRVMIGTPEYMSPEQVEAKDIDQRSDIYSLGIIMYEMLTGSVPFEADTPFAIGVKHKSEAPKNPKELNPQIQDNLSNVILRCLEKDTKNRFQNSRELFTALTAIEKGIPTTEQAAPPKKATTSKEVTVTFQRRWVWAVVSFMIVAAAIFAFLFIQGKRDTVLQDKYWLVVLPFENLGSSEDEYFADGITRAITDRISFIEELDVISNTSAILYKGTNKTIRQIKEDLGVDYAVTGDVRWDKSTEQEGQVLVSSRLIRASDDTQLWSDNFMRSFDEILNVQAQIAEEVVKALDLTLLEPVREAIWAKSTENMDAYDLYLRAREQNIKAWRDLYMSEFDKTVELYEKVTALDPDFIDAWLDLSSLHSAIFYYGINKSELVLEKSRAALEKAQMINSNYPGTKLCWARYYFWGFLDSEQAEELYESVRKIRPNISSWLIGQIYAAQGKFEQAAEAYEEETKRDPLNPGPQQSYAEILVRMRRYEDALKWYDRTLTLLPEDITILSEKTQCLIMKNGYTEELKAVINMIPSEVIKSYASAYVSATYSRNFEEALRQVELMKGDSFWIVSVYFNKNLAYALLYHMMKKPSLKESYAESARQTLESLIIQFPEDPRYHSFLGLAYAFLGRKEEALREGNEAVNLYPITKDARWGASYLLNLSHILIIVEEYEKALDHLEYLMSIEAGRDVSIATLQTQPIYDSVRNHPRFKKLLEIYSQ